MKNQYESIEGSKIEQYAIVHAGARSYMGKPSSDEEGATDAVTALDTHSVFGMTTLRNAFELQVLMREVGGGRVERMPVLLPLDITTSPMLLRVRPTAVYLCSDMNRTDRERYAELLETAIDRARGATSGKSRIILG